MLRVNIKQQGAITQHLTFEDTTQENCIAKLKDIIARQNISIFAGGYSTTVEVREGIGKENGKAMSFSFKGLSPKEVLDIFLNEFK